jgi:DNA-binding transcriptional ArsR family regulator
VLDGEMLERIGERFRALGEPARLRILDALRAGELTVGALVEETGLNQANLSRHLQLLHSLGFVARWKHGLFVYYRLADADVFRLCDLMCGRITRPRTAATARPRTVERPRTTQARTRPT